MMRLGTLVLVLGAVVVSISCEKPGTPIQPTPSPKINTPLWEQDVPAGMKLVEGKPVNLHVDWDRANKGPQALLQFQLTEEHGYMVDGIAVEFWYRAKNDAGEWVDDSTVINFYVKDRLMPGETLVASTPLLSPEFKHLGIDLSTTTKENWQVQIATHLRAMEKAE